VWRELHGGVAEPGRCGGNARAQFGGGLGSGRRVAVRDKQDRDVVQGRAGLRWQRLVLLPGVSGPSGGIEPPGGVMQPHPGRAIGYCLREPGGPRGQRPGMAGDLG
jgi:hypothetical protein